MVAVKTLMWLATTAMAGRWGGFVMMAIDGYDFDGVFYPASGSLAEIGMGIALLGDGAVITLAVIVWIVMSSTVDAARSSMAVTDWDHSGGAVWGWWLVPVAWLWMPRRVYVEIASKAWRSRAEYVTSTVNRWWLSLWAWSVTLALVLVPGGPLWHVAVSGVGLAMAVAATSTASRMLDFISRPEAGSVEVAPSNRTSGVSAVETPADLPGGPLRADHRLAE